jgi:hypothetical protein
MTFDEIDARQRAVVQTVERGGREWDDPETDDADDDEPGDEAPHKRDADTTDEEDA